MANPIRQAGGRFGVMTKRKWTGDGSKSSRRLATLIRDEFDLEVEIDDCGEIFHVSRKQILADALAQLISTGRVHLPDTRDRDGKLVPGKQFDFTTNNWIKNVIMVLNYVEPPVGNVNVSNTVQSIVLETVTPELSKPKDEVIVDEPAKQSD